MVELAIYIVSFVIVVMAAIFVLCLVGGLIGGVITLASEINQPKPKTPQELRSSRQLAWIVTLILLPAMGFGYGWIAGLVALGVDAIIVWRIWPSPSRLAADAMAHPSEKNVKVHPRRFDESRYLTPEERCKSHHW